jgi:hypothetical protein
MDKITYLTNFNFGFIELAFNNVNNFLNVFNQEKNSLVLIAMDQNSYDSMSSFLKEKKQENIIKLKKNFTEYKDVANFNTKEFINITHKKINIILEELLLTKYLHYFDSDVVFFKDPNEIIFDKLKNNDIVFQLDQPYTYHHDLYHNYVCAGNFSIKNNEKSINFLKNIITRLNNNQNDQEVLFHFLNQNCKNIKEYKECILDVYDPELIQNGYDAFVGNWFLKNEKYCIHANHMIGKETKINALKKCNGWFL